MVKQLKYCNTIGELKQAIENLPDDLKFVSFDYYDEVILRISPHSKYTIYVDLQPITKMRKKNL